MKASDFMKLTDEDRRKMFDKRIGMCAYEHCGRPVTQLQEHRTVPDGVYHEDCYWNAFGDLIEQHPIHTPRRRGIGGVMIEDSSLGGKA